MLHQTLNSQSCVSFFIQVTMVTVRGTATIYGCNTNPLSLRLLGMIVAKKHDASFELGHLDGANFVNENSIEK